MSTPVALDQLRAELVRFGAEAYLLTVTDDGRPHAVAVLVEWDGVLLAADAGSRTMANLAARPAVSLLWPPYESGGYSLIVDGMAGVERSDRSTIEPKKAVLHRRKLGTPGSDCVTVLSH